MAFSMSNGYVYFQAKALEEVARQQAEQAGAMDVVTMAAGDPTMGRVLFTVVDQLRKNGLIARELIKDQYFGGYFTIITGGRAMKGFYTPFHAEAFGSIAKMEQQKTGILKNFKSVKPFAHKE
jgi:predicted DNA-binding transcriptional regulator